MSEERIAAHMREISRSGLRRLEHDMPDGKILDTRYAPIPEGGLLLTCRDVTEARRTERALEASEERYALAVEAFGEGIYDWDITSDSIYYSPGLYAMFGLEKRISGPRPTMSLASIPTIGPDSERRTSITSRA